jgi:NADP-dependent 3-hydroxy acid dehydrogenase YdfG
MTLSRTVHSPLTTHEMNLQGKTVLITGASKGIGRRLAVDLARQGANLALVARSAEDLKLVQAEAEEAGATVLIFTGSVADEKLANDAVKKTRATFGRIDFLINNAGFGVFGPIESYGEKVWSDIYDTNVRGTFLFCKAVLPSMREAGEGHIVNVASDVAKRVFDGGALYCSSKFAQDAFSAALRKEVRKHGIKVSVVYSGLVDTAFHPDPYSAEKKDWLTDENMSNTICYILKQPKHVVIDELMIHPLSQEY